MPTIYDVAKLAEVSPKTVSRVLNGEPAVAEETRARVLAAMKQLDYHPNAIAASLKRQRSNIIGFVVPYGSEFVFQDPNMMEQLRGVHDVVTQAGYDLLLSVPVERKDALSELLRLVRNKNIDGVILYPTAGVERIIKELNQKNFKYVTLERYREDQQTNYVRINAVAGVYQATRYLLEKGHRRIGLINKPASFFNYCCSEDSLINGYASALAEAGMEVDAGLVETGDYTFEGGYQAFMNIREREPGVTAVICASDPMAYGAIRAAEDGGMAVGRDLLVVSGDNLPLTRKLYPMLPALSNPSFEQGRYAGDMLLTLIKEKRDLPGISLDARFVPPKGL